MDDLVILIPAYNPIEKLIKIINELSDEKINVIVINDGSSKEFNKIFDDIKKKCILLNHEVNMGKGCAIKTGLKYIKEKYKDKIIVTMDADGQHSIKDAIKVYKYTLENKDSLIIGSRKINTNTPIRSKIGNTITRFIYHITTGTKIYDTQSGLRGFYIDMIDKLLNIKGERYEYEMNVLLDFSKNRIPIKEINIKTIYIDNNSSSHFDTIKDSIRVYKEIIKFSFVSILSFIIDFILYWSFLVILRNSIYSLQLSNVLSRLLSSSFNYTMNKNYVFESNNTKTIFGYILLAVCILILNTTILSILVSKLLINKYIAKILTEIILFIISFIIQQKVIFKK